MKRNNNIIISSSSEESEEENPLPLMTGKTVCGLSLSDLSRSQSHGATERAKNVPLFVNNAQANKNHGLQSPRRAEYSTSKHSSNSVAAGIKSAANSSSSVERTSTASEHISGDFHSQPTQATVMKSRDTAWNRTSAAGQEQISPTRATIIRSRIQQDSSDDDFEVPCSQNRPQASAKLYIETVPSISTKSTHVPFASAKAKVQMSETTPGNYKPLQASSSTPSTHCNSIQRVGLFDRVSRILSTSSTIKSPQHISTAVTDKLDCFEETDHDSPVLSPSERRRLSRKHAQPLQFDSDIGSSSDDSQVEKLEPPLIYENLPGEKNEYLNAAASISLITSRSSPPSVIHISTTESDSDSENIFMRKSESSTPTAFPCSPVNANVDDIRSTVGTCSVLQMSSQCNGLQSFARQLDADAAQSEQIGQSVCVCLQRLQLNAVPLGVMLTPEDRISLSGSDASAVENVTKTSKVSVTRMSDIQHALETSCNSCITSGDELFSEDETFTACNYIMSAAEREIELVANALVCKKDIEARHQTGQTRQTEVENVGAVKLPVCLPLAGIRSESVVDLDVLKQESRELSTLQPSTSTFVPYSQAEDYIVIESDSDDELFANLTQHDVSAMTGDADGNEAEDDDMDGCRIIDDDGAETWTNHAEKNVDGASRDRSRSPDVETGGTPVHADESEDMWKDDLTVEDLDHAYSSVVDPMSDARTKAEDGAWKRVVGSKDENKNTVVADDSNVWSDNDELILLAECSPVEHAQELEKVMLAAAAGGAQLPQEDLTECSKMPSVVDIIKCLDLGPDVVETMSLKASTSRQMQAEKQALLCLERLEIATLPNTSQLTGEMCRNATSMTFDTGKFYQEHKLQMTNSIFDAEQDTCKEDASGSDTEESNQQALSRGRTLDLDSEVFEFYRDEIGDSPKTSLVKRQHSGFADTETSGDDDEEFADEPVRKKAKRSQALVYQEEDDQHSASDESDIILPVHRQRAKRTRVLRYEDDEKEHDAIPNSSDLLSSKMNRTDSSECWLSKRPESPTHVRTKSASEQPATKIAQMYEFKAPSLKKVRYSAARKTVTSSDGYELSQVTRAKQQLLNRSKQLQTFGSQVKAKRDYKSLAKNHLESHDLNGAIEAEPAENNAAVDRSSACKTALPVAELLPHKQDVQVDGDKSPHVTANIKRGFQKADVNSMDLRQKLPDTRKSAGAPGSLDKKGAIATKTSSSNQKDGSKRAAHVSANSFSSNSVGVAGAKKKKVPTATLR